MTCFALIELYADYSKRIVCVYASKDRAFDELFSLEKKHPSDVYGIEEIEYVGQVS